MLRLLERDIRPSQIMTRQAFDFDRHSITAGRPNLQCVRSAAVEAVLVGPAVETNIGFVESYR